MNTSRFTSWRSLLLLLFALTCAPQKNEAAEFTLESTYEGFVGGQIVTGRLQLQVLTNVYWWNDGVFFIEHGYLDGIGTNYWNPSVETCPGYSFSQISVAAAVAMQDPIFLEGLNGGAYILAVEYCYWIQEWDKQLCCCCIYNYEPTGEFIVLGANHTNSFSGSEVTHRITGPVSTGENECTWDSCCGYRTTPNITMTEMLVNAIRKPTDKRSKADLEVLKTYFESAPEFMRQKFARWEAKNNPKATDSAPQTENPPPKPTPASDVKETRKQ